MRFRLSVLLFFVSALGIVACGAPTREVCERAAECEIIGVEDIAECDSDLARAVEKDDLSKDRVRACSECLQENSCGIDIVLDCASACQGVSGIVFASNIH